MKVEINGIPYVPRVDVTPFTGADRTEAAMALLDGLSLYGTPKSRGHTNAIWDALRALVPSIASRSDLGPSDMMDIISPGWRDE